MTFGSGARGALCMVLFGLVLGCGSSRYRPAPLQPSACAGVDLQPASGQLDEQALVSFLKAQGLPARVQKARGDLVYVEVQRNPPSDQWIRFRVAILGNSMQAGRELHDAILQHRKNGGWGIRRSNLAILVESGGKIDDTVAFASKTKLACFGVLTVAASDEAVVIPGGYREL